MKKSVRTKKSDLVIILSISILSAILYLSLGEAIMQYGNDENHSLLLRFLPVCMIQFGMTGLGVLLVMRKNKETFTQYGLVKKNMWKSILACLLVSIPTVIFLFFTDDLHGFLPFQGMFLTDDILDAMFPFNVLGYCMIALVWGFGEGFFYVVLADKVNYPHLAKPNGS